MSKFKDSLGNIGQRFSEALMDMSPRDRRLLAGMAITITIGLFGSGLWWMESREADMQVKIEQRKATLSTIQDQLAGHRTAEAEVNALQQRLTNHEGSSLASFIERSSKTAKVDDRLTGVSSRQSSRDGDVETSRYAMTLKKLSLEELIGFVFTVETADYPVRIDTMKITRSKSEDVMVLSTTMELSAYSLISTDNGERK